MKTVHKQFYTIEDLAKSDGVVSLEVPRNSRILKVANQHDTLAFWYLCDPQESLKTVYTYHAIGTGHPVPDQCFQFVDTVLFRGGSFVLHIFETVNKEQS